MPAKNGQISPVGRRLWCPDHGRYPRRQAVLPKRGTTAKNHPGLGFIWGIPVFKSLVWAPITLWAGRYQNLSAGIEAERVLRRVESFPTSPGRLPHLRARRPPSY